MNCRELTIPIYLDTNALMDVLASAEDGFSIIENVVTRTNGQAANSPPETAPHAPGFVNFIGLNTRRVGPDPVKGQDRPRTGPDSYHTYGSLLNRFIKNSKESGLIRTRVDGDSWNSIATSEFVEVEGVIRPSPLYETFQSIKRLIDFIITYDNCEARYNDAAKRYPDVNSKLSEMKSKIDKLSEKKNLYNKEIEILKQLKVDYENYLQQNAPILTQYENLKNMFFVKSLASEILKEMEASGVKTYIVEIKDMPGHKAVITLHDEYNKDRSGVELPNGHYRVLGKVVNNVVDGGSINLLRRSSLSALEEGLINDFTVNMDKIKGSTTGLMIPELKLKVEAPVLQIIPIAIYI